MTLALHPDPQLAVLIGAPHRDEVAMHNDLAAIEKEFDEGGTVARRGVISYYAAATLAGAGDLSSWQAAIERMSQADLATGVITPFYQPALQVIGDALLPLPGRAQATPW